MKVFTIFVFFCVALTTNAQHKAFKEELEPFVLPNHSVLDYAIGDINNDNLEDAIIIFKRFGEDTIPMGDNAFFNDPIPRPMLLLLRDTFGSMYEAKRIDHLIKCRSCGGEEDEPFESLTIKNNILTFIFKSGTAKRVFTETLHYQWNGKNSHWYLNSFKVSEYFTLNSVGENSYHFTITQDEFLQPITMDDDPFWAIRRSEIYNNKISIRIDTTFFYNEPDINAQPNGKYLLKGESAFPLIETKHFLWILYIHPKTLKKTRGFILKQGITVAIRKPYKKTIH
jgi:hypothetical protein